MYQQKDLSAIMTMLDPNVVATFKQGKMAECAVALAEYVQKEREAAHEEGHRAGRLDPRGRETPRSMIVDVEPGSVLHTLIEKIASPTVTVTVDPPSVNNSFSFSDSFVGLSSERMASVIKAAQEMRPPQRARGSLAFGPMSIMREAATRLRANGEHQLAFDLDAVANQTEAPIKRFKVRLHFVGMPNESMWSATVRTTWGDRERWYPDWRYEAQAVDNWLHASEIRTAEKPSDTKTRIEIDPMRSHWVRVTADTMPEEMRDAGTEFFAQCLKKGRVFKWEDLWECLIDALPYDPFSPLKPEPTPPEPTPTEDFEE